MTVIISMLRGINVGGHNKIKMETLRALYESLGLHDPQTYVQSGNVVFKTDRCDLIVLANRIEDAIERSFGFRTAVILRTSAELREVVARNPFGKRHHVESNKLLVTFLASLPAAEDRDKVVDLKTDPEELWLDGREVYIYFPNGMARPKISWIAIEKMLKTSRTGRNWNSVARLLEMAEKMEQSE